MRCPPCQTPMQVREFWDDSEEAILTWTKGWHCDHCGYRINPLAEFNRRFAKSEEKPVMQSQASYWMMCP